MDLAQIFMLIGPKKTNLIDEYKNTYDIQFHLYLQFQYTTMFIFNQPPNSIIYNLVIDLGKIKKIGPKFLIQENNV